VDCVGVAVVADDGVLYAVADYSHLRRMTNGGTNTELCAADF
jgi:hypothetical protein